MVVTLLFYFSMVSLFNLSLLCDKRGSLSDLGGSASETSLLNHANPIDIFSALSVQFHHQYHSQLPLQTSCVCISRKSLLLNEAESHSRQIL